MRSEQAGVMLFVLIAKVDQQNLRVTSTMTQHFSTELSRRQISSTSSNPGSFLVMGLVWSFKSQKKMRKVSIKFRCHQSCHNKQQQQPNKQQAAATTELSGGENNNKQQQTTTQL